MHGKDYREVNLKYPVLIVLGNEANGPSPDVLNLTHEVISIPKGDRASAESLNVAIAAGILAARFSV
jgi:TrmH family RNA methyltransferase